MTIVSAVLATACHSVNQATRQVVARPSVSAIVAGRRPRTSSSTNGHA